MGRPWRWSPARPASALLGPGHARPGHRPLVRPPAATGPPARPDPAGRQHHPLPGGHRGRRHRRPGAGQPPAPPPGGLAAAGPGPVGVGVRAGRRVRPLRGGRPARCPARRRLGDHLQPRDRVHGAGLRRLHPAAHPALRVDVRAARGPGARRSLGPRHRGGVHRQCRGPGSGGLVAGGALPPRPRDRAPAGRRGDGPRSTPTPRRSSGPAAAATAGSPPATVPARPAAAPGAPRNRPPCGRRPAPWHQATRHNGA
jgi:hypothetical protein